MIDRGFVDRIENGKPVRYEVREYGEGYQHSSHGRTTLDVQCPFCNAWMTVYVWSFAGSGKRCECGALISLRGGARRKVT